MPVSKTLRLSIIATLALASTVLAIMSYNILNPKEPEPEQPKVEAKQEPQPQPEPPPKKKVVWAFPHREPPPSVRIITLDKERSFTVKNCWNLVCE
jgi:hypothetical protein